MYIPKETLRKYSNESLTEIKRHAGIGMREAVTAIRANTPLIITTKELNDREIIEAKSK